MKEHSLFNGCLIYKNCFVSEKILPRKGERFIILNKLCFVGTVYCSGYFGHLRWMTFKNILLNFRAPLFVAKPSLTPVIEYISSESIHKFPTEACPLCKKIALAENPEVFRISIIAIA